MEKKQQPCNLCGGNDFRVRETAEDPFRVLECVSCGLIFVRPLPESGVLAAHYDESYYKDWIAAAGKKRLAMWKNRLDGLEKSLSPGRLLDVGCAEGAFLSLAAERGWKISGTEVSSFAASYAAKVSGAEIFCGELYQAGYAANSFDAVTLWHVLEHMSDPKRCLEEVFRILAPGGLLVLAVPNVNDLVMRVAYTALRFRRPKLFSTGDREVHLYHFSPKTIKSIMEAAGFDRVVVGPDNGIADTAKKLINAAALLPYYMFGAGVFNAIEARAVRPG